MADRSCVHGSLKAQRYPAHTAVALLLGPRRTSVLNPGAWGARALSLPLASLVARLYLSLLHLISVFPVLQKEDVLF